jgi:hypothetical protein
MPAGMDEPMPLRRTRRMDNSKRYCLHHLATLQHDHAACSQLAYSLLGSTSSKATAGPFDINGCGCTILHLSAAEVQQLHQPLLEVTWAPKRRAVAGGERRRQCSCGRLS